MMKKCLIILAIIAIGCTKELKKEDTVPVKIEVEREFKVKIKYRTNKVGVFKLALYNIFPSETQSRWIQINEEVEATTAMENLKANFGKNISNSFRIELGNKQVRKVEFELIEIFFGDKKIRITPEELSTHFKFNEYLDIEENTFAIQTKRVNDKLNPIITLKKEFLEELKLQ